MTYPRREELNAEIALDDRPQTLIRTARQAHPSDDLIAQQRVGVTHRVLEQFLFGLEIVVDDAFGRTRLLCNFFNGCPAHTLRLEDLEGSVAQLSASNIAYSRKAHVTMLTYLAKEINNWPSDQFMS